MPVAELIALLQAMDPELPVESMGCDCVHPVTKAENGAVRTRNDGTHNAVLLHADGH